MKSPGARIIRWRLKPALHILLLLPAASLVWGAFSNGLGVNPVETLTHSTGEWGLRILLLALAVTPLARITKSGWVLQVRRLVGLYAFFYGLIHFLIYLVFDLALDFGFVPGPVFSRPDQAGLQTCLQCPLHITEDIVTDHKAVCGVSPCGFSHLPEKLCIGLAHDSGLHIRSELDGPYKCPRIQ